MHNHKLYSSYVFQLRQSFFSGISKAMDIWNFSSVKYPSFMTDEEANIFDAHEIANDFIAVGKDLGRALDSYGRNAN